MTNTRFSIATPTRNSLDKLKRCVGSVRGQRGVTLEHLVQDAQSSDGTPAWLSEQHGLQAVSEPDAGMYDAINRAWARSHGEFLSWLNSDEQYLPGTLAKVQEFFDAHPEVDVVFGDYIVADLQGRPVALRREIPFRRIYAANSFINTASCTLFFRRRLHDQGLLNLDRNYRYCADKDLVLRLAAAGKVIRRIPEYLAVFGIDGTNLSTHPQMDEEAELIRCANGAFRMEALRQLVLVGRRIERLLSGGYRRDHIRYHYAVDETPHYVEYEAANLGGRYSLADIEGRADSVRPRAVIASPQRLPLEGKLIAFFHQSSDLYGSDRILLDLTDGVQNAGGHAVVLLPCVGPLTEEFAARNIEFHTLPVLKLSRSMVGLKGAFHLLRAMTTALSVYDKVFGSRRVDMVHSNTLAVLGGALWARRRRIPHLWHVHEIVKHPWIAAHAFPRLINWMADRVVCNSDATRQWLRDAQPSLNRKMSVIRNGVSAPTCWDALSTSELQRKFRPAGAHLAVGLVGRINRFKGHNLLMDAVDLLHRRGVNDFSVVFVGSAPPGQEFYQTQLEQRIARSPMRERIVVQGFTNNVWPIYAALDIVCVPSTEPESFGLVAAEAMAIGKPVVASRIGALSEVVVDGATGLTFDPQDAEALAAALEKLLCADSLRAIMGCAGKVRIETTFSTETMKTKFVALCHSIISSAQ